MMAHAAHDQTHAASGVRYRRVSRDEENEAEDVKKRQSDRIERITAKLHALFWVASSATLAYQLDMLGLITGDHRVGRISLNIGILSLVASITIILYLTIWLPLVMKIDIPWDVYCPRMIPTATLLGVLSIVFFMIAFWPLWGLLTPLVRSTIYIQSDKKSDIFIFYIQVILTYCMGLLFSTHFIPYPF